MPDIKISTVADLKGFRDLQSEMNKMIQQAEKYTSLMRSAGAPRQGTSQVLAKGPSGGAIQANSGFPPSAGGSRHQMGGGGPSYNMTSSSGVAQYYENVVMPAMGALNLGTRGSGRSSTRQQTSSTTLSMAGRDQITSWFNSLESEIHNMNRGVQNAYFGARAAAMSSTDALPESVQRFYNIYGQRLGAPSGETAPDRSTFASKFMQHFANSARGGSFGRMIVGGIQGGLTGSAIDMLMGGGEAGAAAGMLGGSGMGAMLGGGLAAGGVGAIVTGLVSWIGGQIKQGMQTYSDTAGAFSQFSHALDGATNSAEGFREATLRAGAVTGMNAQQSTQVAATLMSSFGNSLGNSGLTRMTKQTGLFALHSGLDPTVAAAIDALGAQLGITNGVGSTINPLNFNGMLQNVTNQSRMGGRQGSLYTGLMSVYSGLGAVNPIITSANSTAAIYSAMNATGIEGLQAQSGANVLSTMNSNIGSGQGLGGLMSMAAISQASGGKITNPWQMQSIMEQGLGAKVGGTTLGAQLTQMVEKMAPGDIFTQAGLLAQMTGISENQAVQMLKSGALSARSISTQNNQYQRNTLYDQNNIVHDVLNAQSSKFGYTVASVKSAAAKVGGVPTGTTLAGPSGNAYVGAAPPATQQQQISQAVAQHVSEKNMGTYQWVTDVMDSIAYQESRGNPYSINDNTAGDKTLTFSNRASYLATAHKLLAEHHQLALGPFQLESFHKGVTPESAINPTFAANEALNILLNGKNPATFQTSDWVNALQHYSNDLSTGPNSYAYQVLNRAAGYAHGTNEVTLSQATISALGQMIAHYLSTTPTH